MSVKHSVWQNEKINISDANQSKKKKKKKMLEEVILDENKRKKKKKKTLRDWATCWF